MWYCKAFVADWKKIKDLHAKEHLPHSFVRTFDCVFGFGVLLLYTIKCSSVGKKKNVSNIFIVKRKKKHFIELAIYSPHAVRKYVACLCNKLFAVRNLKYSTYMQPIHADHRNKQKKNRTEPNRQRLYELQKPYTFYFQYAREYRADLNSIIKTISSEFRMKIALRHQMRVHKHTKANQETKFK